MVREMNTDELIVFKYLNQLDRGEVIWEPDGNIPPDFAINSKIAVEARRLNQNFQKGETRESLETLSYSLNEVMDEVLCSFDANYSGKSYDVQLTFRRPVEPIHTLKNKLRRHLANFLGQNGPLPKEIMVASKITLVFYDRLPNPGKTFIKLPIRDHNYEGWIRSSYIKNIDLCISEKNQKVNNFLHKYSEWWLVLVDRTLHHMDEDDRIMIVQYLVDLGNFSQLHVVNMNNLVPEMIIRK